MKRLILLFLCIAMCVPLFAACTGDDSEKDPDTTASLNNTTTSVQTSAVPESSGTDDSDEPDITTVPDYGYDDVVKKDWDGYLFKVLYPDRLDVEYDFLCEDTLTGNVLNDQVYTRNKMVEEACNIEIFVDIYTSTAYTKTLDAQHSSGWTEGDYNYVGANGNGSLKYALNGTLADLATYDEINIYRNYWEQGYLDEIMIYDSIYALVGEISVDDQLEIEALLFNKNLFNQEGFDEPYDSVRAMEWTVDMLMGYMEGFAKDYDGNGYDIDKDRFSITGWYFTASHATLYGSGFKFCKNDGETITVNFDTDFADDVIDVCLNIWAKNGAHLVDTKILGRETTYEEATKIFADDRALFTSVKMVDISSLLSEMEGDYGILPSPMFNTDQGRYYTYVNNGIPMAVVPATDPNPERTGNIIEALCSASHSVVTPKLFEVVTKIQGTRDEDSAEMIEICRTTKIFDAAHWFELNGLSTVSLVMCQERQNIMSSYLKMYLGKAEREMGTIIEGYNKLKK